MLVVCSTCGRHCKPARACFFCGATLAAPRPGARARVSRGAAFAAVAAAGIACGARTDLGGARRANDASTDAPAGDAQALDGSGEDATLTFYGGPPLEAGTFDASDDPVLPDVIALYGAPPPQGD